MTPIEYADYTPKGWLLYDGACGFCSRWVPFWAKTLRGISIDFVPLQELWVREKLGVDETELLRDLRLLLIDGTQIRGADVYRYVMKRVWWAYPLYVLAVSPIFRSIFDWGYATFAKNRYRISKSCGWSPER